MQIRLPDERWTQIEALFQEAADLPPASRDEFLRLKCGDDPQLREEVLSLLRYDTGPQFESPLLDALQASAASLVTDEPAAGRLLGPYRIEREIGRGGMSVVYSAVRADGEFLKRVAIKLIKRGMDTQIVVQRLRRERRILAALEHPSIARLLDGGTTAEGLPWIAMEYVEGLPIHRYCAERNPTIEDRCRLIDKVCDAVACAHRNLVVHRDLKPSNILIATDGNPKLLDFGIAKLLGDGEEGEPEGPDGPLTRNNSRPLTPGYASPEQVCGGAVGTSTDVYSLGVVLYELLTGRRPRREDGKEDVEKASDAAAHAGKDQRWSRHLAGDLDNILQMALREEPERRYPTVERFQADLKRYLAGLPVAARPVTWFYRFGKFVRRHPVGVPASVAFVLAVVVGVFLIVRAERDADLQRARSEQRVGQLVALANTALFDLHGAIESLPGATQARLEIVQKTLVYLDRLNSESGDDTRVLTALASAYDRIARVQGSPLQPNIGDLRGAEKSYLKAEKILTALLAREDNPALRLQDSGVRMEYGMLIADTGRKDEALAEYRRSLAETAAILARDPHNLEARRTSARVHVDVGLITKVKDPVGTRRTDLALLPEFEAMVRDYPHDNDCLLSLASLWSQIGQTFDLESNPAEAVVNFRKASELRERLFALQPDDVQVQHDLLIGFGHLGDLTGSPLFSGLGDYRGAVVWYRKAVDIAARMAAADPSNAQARNDEGTAYMRIGVSQVAAGQNAEALENLKRAELLLEPLRAVSPDSITLAERVSIMYGYRARALAGLGRPADALDSLRRSTSICLAVLRKHPDPSSQHTLWTDRGLQASALASLGRSAEAVAEAEGVLENIRRFPIPGDPFGSHFLFRALEANGAVHSILAKQSPAADRISEWRIAADFHREAVAGWKSFPAHLKEPYVRDFRLAEAGLAEAERELRKPAP